jgi:hypothetical protein
MKPRDVRMPRTISSAYCLPARTLRGAIQHFSPKASRCSTILKAVSRSASLA